MSPLIWLGVDVIKGLGEDLLLSTDLINLLRPGECSVTNRRACRKKYYQRTVLILYGASNETHEAAFLVSGSYEHMEGSEITSEFKNGMLVVNWAVTPSRKIIKIGPCLYVYLLGKSSSKSSGVSLHSIRS